MQRFETDVDLPSAGEPVVYIPQAGPGAHRDGILLRLNRRDGTSWLALVATQFPAVTGPFELPDGDRVYVNNHVLNAELPNDWHEVGLTYAKSVHFSPDGRFVVLCGDSELVAYGPGGLAWESSRLVLDGLEVTHFEAGNVHCLGYAIEDLSDPTGQLKSRRLTLELLTGRIVSGKPYPGT